jgi:hypothetical protein
VTQTANLGGVFRVAGLLILLSCHGVAALAQGEARDEQEFANYSFAHELGSGVYEAGGRLMQIYRLPFQWRIRETNAVAPGITLLLPATLGFFDFDPTGVVQDGLPDGIDSLSFVPGIGLEFLRGGWRLMPFAKLGIAIADQDDVSATLYSAGVLGESSRQHASGWRSRRRSDLLYSGVNYRGGLPRDAFVRWRNGAEAVQGLGVAFARRELEGGVFAVLDWYLDPPTGPVTGIDIPALQFEAGVMLGTRPALKWGRVPIPRIGLSYRFAGDVSAWRLVLGAPF